LVVAVRTGRFDGDTLIDMAKKFGRRGTVIAIADVIATARKQG
jgi:hypothetical protein